MKRIIALWVALACFGIVNVHAAYLRNIPVTVTQPDGIVLHCFASGDEFFNYLHDSDGYTIIQHPQTGYYVYAENRDGTLVATDYVADRHDPMSKGLQPFALISPEEWMARRRTWEVPDEHLKNRDFTPNHGTLNNISIFIRFSDDGQFTNTYSSIANMFNDVSEGAISMRSYFRAASYGVMEIPTTFYPGHSGETIISYQDTYPRSYFQPYNAYTNPNGYQEENKAEREFGLLERAVNYINANYPVPTNLNIDYDGDGYVDNVCFIVKGDVGDWSSLLWPHQWALYDRTVNINGKRVWTFNFQLADASGYFNTSTMCHEMNHSLGAPDLYHYSHSGLEPVGSWDLMDGNATPPQHCGAYMKMKYGHWIDEIPEITQSGTYTLNPISSSSPTNVAYKIVTSDPNQFYVLEYRNTSNPFESALPGSGLLIYRIDSRFDGNRDYDPSNGIYDEIYIFRPNGTVSVNGDLSRAHFSSGVSRTEFSPSTNPYPFFTDGIIDNNIRIYNVTNAGSTISFSVQINNSSYSVTTVASPSNGGTVSGGGNFNGGANCTLTATPTEGYTFTNWTENGNVVSSNPTFSFNVSSNRNLVANFALSENHWTPEGSSYSGVMSVYGVIQINGVEQYSDQLEVGVFCGDECRGSAIASEFFLTHRYLAILTVYGENGHQLTFKLYDHSTGQEYESISQETITFNEDGYGNPIEPYVLNFAVEEVSGFHFITAGNWSTASNWQGGTLPNTNGMVFIDAPCQLNQDAEVAALTISNGQSLTLQSGKILTVTNTLINTSTTGLVIEDGAQLVHASENVSAIVKKNIAGHGTCNGKYYLVSNPLTSIVNPSQTSIYHLTNGNYDLYNWLASTIDDLEWRNFKKNTFMMSPEGYGYLYANRNSVELNFPGTLRPSNYRFGKSVSYDSGDTEHPGWNLIGNPFVCNVYLVNGNNELLPFYRMNAAGNSFVVAMGIIAPMEGVFYQASENGTVYFTRADFTPQIPTYRINVSANLSSSGTVSGGGTYQLCQSCTVQATANTGYTFLRWTENGTQVSTNASYTFTVTGNRTLVAQFQAQGYPISVSANPSNGGTVSGGGSYNYGQSCTVSATAATGYTFLRWTENGTQVSTNANYTFTVTGNRTLVAQFQAQSYIINVSANPTNGGSVTGGGNYNYGQSCTVSATAATGYTFLRWTENGTQVSTNANYTFTVTSNRNLVANFSQQTQTYTITASASPSAGGSVSGVGNYNNGATCTLIATPATGYSFVRWTKNGNQVSTNASYSFTVTENATYVAVFSLNSYTVSASANPTAGGSVTVGNSVLTASFEGSFGGWTTIDADGDGYNWGLASIEYYGYLIPSHSGEDCVTSASYDGNSAMPLNPDNYLVSPQIQLGGSITFWACAQDTEYSAEHFGVAVSTTSNTDPSAFTTIQEWTMSAKSEGQGTGNYKTRSRSGREGNWYEYTVDLSAYSGQGYVAIRHFDCTDMFYLNVDDITIITPSLGGGSSSGVFTYGTSCTLTATPATGYTFLRWTENGTQVSTNANYTFTVTGNRTLKANFTYNGGNTHEYVDLGLPSGLLWATCNVGADNPEDYGDYFAWGETQTKDVYNWSTYQYCMGSSNTLTKYCNNSSYGYNGFTDDLTTLLSEDDAATANWGDGWRMPTKEEWEELKNNTTNTWTTRNGVNGRLFTATNGNSLFLPAAGFHYGSSLSNAGLRGFYWSSSLHTDYPEGLNAAWSLGFASGDCNILQFARRDGYSVRAVRSASQNNVPTGAINGKFTINSSGDKVYFSQGNLQYQASTQTWRFAECQWDYVGAQTPQFGESGGTVNGSDNSMISQYYNGWIDLFGWGTSGWDNGNVYYKPWDYQNNGNPSQGYGYGPTDGTNYNYNLTDDYANADWGVYNPINNGGNQAGQWRTLTNAEWRFLLYSRPTLSGIRWAKAQIMIVSGESIDGLILLPDDWNESYYTLNNPNLQGASFNSNMISYSVWNTLEQYGAVFLPKAGIRNTNNVWLNGSRYWSATCLEATNQGYWYVWSLGFGDNFLQLSGDNGRLEGKAVRLVRSAQ